MLVAGLQAARMKRGMRLFGRKPAQCLRVGSDREKAVFW